MGSLGRPAMGSGQAGSPQALAVDAGERGAVISRFGRIDPRSQATGPDDPEARVRRLGWGAARFGAF